MERRISVGIFRPKYVDNLHRWSRIFRSEETETNLAIWIPTEISRIFGIMESTHVDHLQNWYRIFRSEETETNFSIWILTEISGISGIMESTQNFRQSCVLLTDRIEIHQSPPYSMT